MNLVSIRSLLVILLATLCGLFASFGMNMILRLRHPQAAVAADPQTKSVVILQAAVARGQRVTADALTIAQWPKNLTPAGALSEREEAIDRVALQSLVPGEPLLDQKLAERGAVGGMASLIPPGKRAYSIATQRVPANVSGMVLPGNFVDVLLTLRSTQNDETGGGSTTTLLQAVEILAVDRDMERAADSGRGETKDPAKGMTRDATSVTLLVTPDQAARLDLGQTLGNLSLALRNPEDREESQAAPATVASIRFSQSPPDFNSEESEDEASVERLPTPPVVAASGRSQPSVNILTLRGQVWSTTRVRAAR